MKNVIINVDDFGMSKEINLGIIDLFENNAISSTTLMPNMPFAEEAIDLAKKYNITSVGLHLNMTAGENALIPIKKYYRNLLLYRWNKSISVNKLKEFIDVEEVLSNCQNQFKIMVDHGMKPDHLDFHHFFISNPLLEPPLLEWIKSLKIPIRNTLITPSIELQKLGIRTTDRIELNFGFFPTVRKLLKILSSIQDGESVEIMSHAGFYNPHDKKNSRFLNREKELNILKNPRIKDFLSEKKIEMINFQELGEK